MCTNDLGMSDGCNVRYGGHGSLLRDQPGLFLTMMTTREVALPSEHPHSIDAVECAVDRVIVVPVVREGSLIAALY